MMEKIKAEKANELAVRRKRDVEYQNKRKEKLEKLGEHSITIRLNNEDYEALSDICEILGYQRPEAKKRNLIESYSASLVHLLRIERESSIYKPKSRIAKKFYRLYKIVNHLKHDKNYTDNEIITKMTSDKMLTPLSVMNGGEIFSWNEKALKRVLVKEKVIETLKQLDGDFKKPLLIKSSGIG